MSEQLTLSGRDLHIVARAFAIAVAAIEQASPRNRPLSDLHDMKTMLGRLLESDAHFETYINSSKHIFDAEKGA